MLICPECQHENIENNKFCEKCGTSLTHKNCDQCGEKVPFGMVNCPNCNALSVNIYGSVISQFSQDSLCLPEFFANSEEELETTKPYLDSCLRYRIFQGENNDSTKPVFELEGKQFYRVQVMDCKPLQKSSFDSILARLEGIDRQSLIQAGIPSIAFPYLTLAEFCPTVPELYDAWQNEDTKQEFVVISEPKNWQLLSEVLETRDISFLQILNYFEEMTRLWKELSKLRYCQTLLQINNIGIDEDDTLAFKQLYPDEAENPPELEKLLNIWLSLLPDSKIQETNTILKLLDLLNAGEIENIKGLRSMLQKLSQESQLHSLLQEEKEEDLLLIAPEEELNALSEQFDFDDDHDFDEDDVDDEATLVSGDIDDQPTVVLPMQLLSLMDAGFSDIGTRRSHNEDCFAIDTKVNKQESPQGIKCQGRGLYLVCDGMGGHAAGEVASAMAVQNMKTYFQEHWQEEFPDANLITEAILDTNQKIYNVNLKKGSSGSQRMGTTLVMTLIQGTKVAIAHVGDSRIYKVTRKWGLEQLTTDHSVAQMEIKNGVNFQTAYNRVDAFQLTQALGPRENNYVHPDINIMEVKEDTLFFLCSDGLCDNNLLEDNWQTYLSPLISSKANLNEGLSQIIDLANQINGHDNITGVLIRVKVQPNLDNQRF